MYKITNYDELYRPFNKSGGELKNPEWVKLPVNPKGDGLQTLFEHRRGLEVFGIWCLLLEKTTAEKKPENRGKLLNFREESASILEIAKGISLKKQERIVEYALSVLVTMGWIADDSVSEQSSAKGGNKHPPKLSKVKDKLSRSKVKDKYMDFVFLSKEDHKKLIKKFGKRLTTQKIEALNNYIGSKGKKYDSHYHTILVWNCKDDSNKSSKLQLFPIKNKTCEKTNCNLPAVYCDSKGSYDHYFCAEHMPEEVKEKYG